MREGLSAGRSNLGQGGKMELLDVDIAAMSKGSQHCGRATQSAWRVGRALEDAMMRVTGALRGKMFGIGLPDALSDR